MKKYFYISVAVLSIIASFFLDAVMMAGLCFLLIMLLLIKDRSAFLRFGKYRNKLSFWLVLLLLTGIYPFFSSGKNIEILGFAYSIQALELGVRILLKVAVIILSLALIKRSSGNFDPEKFWAKLGLRDFNVVFENSKQFMPQLKSTFSENLNGKSKWRSILNIRHTLALTLATLLRKNQLKDQS